VQARFGVFLHFVTAVTNLKTPNDLTEWRFRKYWERTKGKDEPELSATRRPLLRSLKLPQVTRVVCNSPRHSGAYAIGRSLLRGNNLMHP